VLGPAVSESEAVFAESIPIIRNARNHHKRFDS
jgi:hypothetical protein